MSERLQKILARHGLGSRREIERWITEGRVTVNLQPAQLGYLFQPGDRVAIDGKEVTARLVIEVPVQVIMYHKAQGQPITHDDTRTAKHPELDEDGHSTVTGDVTAKVTGKTKADRNLNEEGDTQSVVVDRLPAIRGSRWVPINLMHAGDSGLLLLTNDGALSYALTRHKREIPTAFMVRVLSPGSVETRLTGPPEIPPHVTYDDKEVAFTSVEPAGGEGSNLWYRVELPRADLRAAVRALFESRYLKVSRMTQVAFGSVELPRDLPRGRHRLLTAEQVATLYELAQIAVPASPQPQDDRDHPRNDPRKHRSVAPDRRKKVKSHNEPRTANARRRSIERETPSAVNKRGRPEMASRASSSRTTGARSTDRDASHAKSKISLRTGKPRTR